MNFRLKISPPQRSSAAFQEMKHQTGGTGWPNGNILDFQGLRLFSQFFSFKVMHKVIPNIVDGDSLECLSTIFGGTVNSVL